MEFNTRITTNFIWGEFWCQGVEPPQQYYANIVALAKELQKLRDIVGKPIRITSGYRTPQHNAAIGGASNSQHLYGKAADIKVSYMHSRIVCLYAVRYTNCNGIGVSNSINSITHLDTRDKFTVWFY